MAKKAFLEIGEVVSTHGVAGEMRVTAWCDSADDFCKLKKLYADPDGKVALKVKSRPHKHVMLVKVDGVNSVQEAATWRGRILYAKREDLALPRGRYFIEDLVGLPVLDEANGTLYGHITAVSNFGAGDIYHMLPENGVTADNREVLIPAIPAIIKRVDIDKAVCITPMKGLFSE